MYIKYPGTHLNVTVLSIECYSRLTRSDNMMPSFLYVEGDSSSLKLDKPLAGNQGSAL